MNTVENGGQRRRLRWLLLSLPFIIFAVFLSREIVIFWMNLSEFGELFILPLYFGLLGGLILATLALFRVDFKNRRSIAWWSIRLVINLVRSKGIRERGSPEWFDFDSFKLSPLKFLVWQVTKVLVGIFFFTNMMFGMAVNAVMLGWKSGLEELPRIFGLPFTTPPLDMAYAEANVIPLTPSLTILVPPVLSALWVRLILLVAVTHFIRIITPLVAANIWDLESNLGMFASTIHRFASTIQALAAVFLLWFMFNMFFSPFIDYNTMYPILGFCAAGVSLAVFALQMLFSHLWLGRFRYGPVEWVWRTGTYGRLGPAERRDGLIDTAPHHVKGLFSLHRVERINVQFIAKHPGLRGIAYLHMRGLQ